VKVSRDLFIVFKRSQELSRLTDGGFDITCSPVIRLWRVARKSGKLPDSAELAAARQLVGWKMIDLDERTQTVRLQRPGMRLDLGAIAKGYADDCAQKVLRRYGVTSALVEAGGDIVVSDPPPGQPGWRILVPNATAGKAVPNSEEVPLLFSNCAISTSGDLEQSVVIDGKRYSHVIDARTGMPLTDRIQVTVVAQDGLTSDGLSTAVSIVGPEKGRTLAAKYPKTKLYIRFAANDEK
jgi:thiamine biosynthesis lipoprotein